MKTIIIGLGNPILKDDGVGAQVAYRLQTQLASWNSEDLSIIEASVGGLRLMESMQGFDRAFIIDAIKSNNGAQPGTIYRMSLDDLRHISPTQHIASTHDTTLITAHQFGQKIGLKLPKEIVIYAIEAEVVDEFGEELTPNVEQAIPEVINQIIGELTREEQSQTNKQEDTHDIT